VVQAEVEKEFNPKEPGNIGGFLLPEGFPGGCCFSNSNGGRRFF
jgi:hypothetical protein